MMVLNRTSGAISHRRFLEIASFLLPGDCLVLNDSKVIPARLRGVSERTGSDVEVLLHEKLTGCGERWEILCKPGRKALAGERIVFGGGRLTALIEGLTEDGLRIAAFGCEGAFRDVISEIGEMPLPHYIKRGPKDAEEAKRYQTVYANNEGSVAAPTAGLHFTDENLSGLRDYGINIAKLTLHIGIGTFRPVRAEEIEDHRMHSEYYKLDEDQARLINQSKKNGGRIIAAGTTSCRVLESVAGEDGFVSPGEGRTGIFIYPGYVFKAVDGLITNFHLPESTLLMLVCAFAGRERALSAYGEAIGKKYRFYSYGDAMLVI